MPSSDQIEWLQSFYSLHCDGDWEHSYGFKIENVDNPGWMVEFDLAETKLSLASFTDVNEQRSDSDWIICRKIGDKFMGSGGALNLAELLTRFRQWVEDNTLANETPWIED